MKKVIMILVAVMAVGLAKAQQISVVSGGSTSIYSSLQAAIEAAPAGSVIYLPGGGFPIADEVKITKKLNIIGIGYWIKGDNVDGYTSIQGNLFFDEGSDGSSVMGVYMTGGINIGKDGKKVDNVLVRYNWIGGVNVYNNECMGTVVNQNYIRGGSSFSGSSADFTNNIAYDVFDLDNGVIAHNILTNGRWSKTHYTHSICHSDNTSIIGNVLMNNDTCGDSCQINGNMTRWGWDADENLVNLEGIEWTDVFVNPDGIDPKSDYHFKGDYVKYSSKCGIYAGSSFSSSTLPPVPYIVAKQIPEQTDADGKLNIKIRVRAGE